MQGAGGKMSIVKKFANSRKTSFNDCLFYQNQIALAGSAVEENEYTKQFSYTEQLRVIVHAYIYL